MGNTPAEDFEQQVESENPPTPREWRKPTA